MWQVLAVMISHPSADIDANWDGGGVCDGIGGGMWDRGSGGLRVPRSGESWGEPDVRVLDGGCWYGRSCL